MLLYVTFFLASVLLFSSSDTNESVIGAKEINSIVDKHFNNCDVFSVEDHDTRVLLNNQILYSSFSILQPSFSIVFSTYKNSTFRVASRKHFQCSIVVAFLTQGAKMLDHFENLFLKDFYAPTHPENDHYFFVTPSSEPPIELMYSTALKKLRFKLFLSLSGAHAPLSVSIFSDNKDGKAIRKIELTTVSTIHDIFPDWTKNGQGHQLKVSTPTKYLFVIELERVKDKWKCKRGHYKTVLETLLPHYNFSFEIFPSPTNDSGKLLPDGTFDGVMGDVINGRADIGLSTSYNFDRYPVLGFSRGLRYIWAVFVLGPPAQTYSWKAIFWPFAWNLWLTITLTLAAVIATFRVIQSHEIYRDDCHLAALRIAFVLAGKEIHPSYPTAPPARLLLGVWLFSSLVLSTVYVSKIVGLLAFPVLKAQPKNFKELVNPKMGYEWKMVGGGNLYAHFESSTSPVLKTVFNRMRPLMTAIDCFRRLRRFKYACITWKGTSDYVADRNLTFINGKSPLITADEDKTLFVPLGLTLSRRSILLPNFNRAIQMLMDSGQSYKWIEMDSELLRREKNRWLKETGEYGKPESDVEKEKLLTLNNLIGVFYLFSLGCTLSIVAYFLEAATCKLIKIRVAVVRAFLT